MGDPVTLAALGLGGNIGEPARSMAQALKHLDMHEAVHLVSVSGLYRTPPWGKTDQADFFNCCALVETSLSPQALLDLCLEIERGMKRERVERWGPRIIDIDVLTYGMEEVATPRVEIPHPRMTDRAFVLMPLADIAADMMVKGRRVADWLDDADKTGILRVDDAQSPWWGGASPVETGNVKA